MSSESIFKKRLGLRIFTILLGITVLIWLSIEEENTLGVVIIAGAICFWAALWVLVKPVESGNQIILRHSLVGIGAGLAIVPLAILLMALKSGLHGHSSPDYSIAQIQDVLSRTPFFALSGFLVGLGSGLWRLARGNAQTEGG